MCLGVINMFGGGGGGGECEGYNTRLHVNCVSPN